MLWELARKSYAHIVGMAGSDTLPFLFFFYLFCCSSFLKFQTSCLAASPDFMKINAMEEKSMPTDDWRVVSGIVPG